MERVGNIICVPDSWNWVPERVMFDSRAKAVVFKIVFCSFFKFKKHSAHTFSVQQSVCTL